MDKIHRRRYNHGSIIINLNEDEGMIAELTNMLGGAWQALQNNFVGQPANPPEAAEPAAEDPKGKEEEVLLPELREEGPGMREDAPEHRSQGASMEDRNPADGISQIQPIRPPSNITLEEEMGLLRVHAIARCDEQVKTEYDRVLKLQKVSNTLGELLNKSADALAAGSIDISKDDEFKKLLDFAKENSVTLPAVEGSVYAKDNIDSLVRNVELKIRAVDTDIKLHQHNAEEAMKVRNQIFEILKSMEDKNHSAILKAARGISGNG